MEEKKKQSTKVKYGKIIGFIVIIVAILAAVVCVNKKIEPEKSLIKINTPYIDLQLPSELESIITYDESTYGDVYTCAFYLNYANNELPLWRFDFGDPDAGEWIGELKTEQESITVCMTGFVVTAEELAALGEDGPAIYGECMQGYSDMLAGIMSDSRFTAERSLAVGEDTDIELTYWNVTLPNMMDVLESNENGNYEAVFYGEVAGEKVSLYRVCIGEKQAESFLGYYEVDDEKKPVSVESFDLSERDDWSEDDYSAAYRMMDTINRVIETIMQSKQYSM